MLQSFHSFLKEPSSLNIQSSTYQYQHKRKDAMTEAEAHQFFPALYQINPTYELIGRVLRYLNYDILLDKEDGEETNTSIVPLESLLRLKKTDVEHNCVTLYARSIDRTSMWSLYLPDELFSRVSQLAEETDLFVFRNKFGGPLDSGQIRRKFAKASKLANLARDISPKHLR